MPDETAIPEAPLSPYLTVDRGIEALEWYKRGLGATELRRQVTPDGQKVVHAVLQINGGLVLLSDEFSEDPAEQSTPAARGGSTVTIHLTLPDIDTLYNQAVAAGATATMPPQDMFWGARYGQLTDPFGHHWSFGTPQKPVSEDQVRQGVAESFPEHA